MLDLFFLTSVEESLFRKLVFFDFNFIFPISNELE
nr:MAG TPA: hypothetical protein [Caudoviricetes sp.]DAZ54797.1 MAG TPA: hypothetical protein [Caudoviricetes sp.]